MPPTIPHVIIENSTIDSPADCQLDNPCPDAYSAQCGAAQWLRKAEDHARWNRWSCYHEALNKCCSRASHSPNLFRDRGYSYKKRALPHQCPQSLWHLIQTKWLWSCIPPDTGCPSSRSLMVEKGFEGACAALSWLDRSLFSRCHLMSRRISKLWLVEPTPYMST